MNSLMYLLKRIGGIAIISCLVMIGLGATNFDSLKYKAKEIVEQPVHSSVTVIPSATPTTKSALVVTPKTKTKTKSNAKVVALQKKNSNVIGIIKAGDVNQPVVQSKADNDRAAEPELNKSVSGGFGSRLVGSPKNMEIASDNANFRILGHHYKNDPNRDFSPLMKFKDEKYAKKNNIIKVETKNKTLKYRIFSIEHVMSGNLNNGYEAQLTSTSVENLLNNSEIDFEAQDALKANSFLTLCTCDYTKVADKGRRLLIHAYLI